MVNLTGTTHAYIEIKQRLIKQILGGTYQVGSKLPTVTDIAMDYGVSRDTVIRAVKDLVRQGVLESRRRVGITVRKMPDRGGVKKDTILAVCRNVPYFPPAFSEALIEVLPGWQLFQTQLNELNSDDYSDSFLDAFIQQNPYEVYLLSSVHVKLKQYFERKNLPCVVVGEVEKGLSLPNVCFDEQARYYQAARFLLDQGYGSLVFLQFKRKSPGDYLREAGVCEAYSEQSFNDELRKPLVVEIDEMAQEPTERRLRDMLNNAQFPLGVISGSDTATCWLLQQAHEKGIAVPGEMGIVTSGVTDLPTHAYPQVSSIRPDQTKLAFSVAKMIHEVVSGYDLVTRRVRIPFEEPYIIERQTTKEAGMMLRPYINS